MEKDDWLWPLRGGTWQERLLALADLLELLLLAAACYCCAWVLAPYF